jgi:hypothetical protein
VWKRYNDQPAETEIHRFIVEHGSIEILQTLANQQYSLRFIGTHFFDLKTILMTAK